MKRILIIDDDADILELLQIIFQDSGHEVVLSRIIVDAEYVSVLHPDLILLDVRINGSKIGGPEMCKNLKKDQRTTTVPVILLSSENNLQAIAVACEANAYIEKPFNVQELLQKVNDYLS